MVLFDRTHDRPGVVTEDCVTAEAASDLTGYSLQYIRRMALDGKLEAFRIGRSWLIKVTSIEHYLAEVVPNGDARFGPRRYAGTKERR